MNEIINDKNQETQLKIEKNISKKDNAVNTEIIKKIQKISNWSEYEYIFFKPGKIENINSLFKNKYIITKNGNNYYLMDAKNVSKENLYNFEKLDYSQEADLIIINDSEKEFEENIEDIINKHTILCKVFRNDIIYLEDAYKNKRIISCGDKIFTLKENGLYTKLYESNMKNT